MNKSFVRISKKSFLGKMYQYKISGYKLVDIIASKDNDKTKLKYILLQLVIIFIQSTAFIYILKYTP